MQPHYWSIDKLPGLPENEQKLLQNLGIVTTKDLLNRANTPQAKQTLASLLQINIKYVNKWVALADLEHRFSKGAIKNSCWGYTDALAYRYSPPLTD